MSEKQFPTRRPDLSFIGKTLVPMYNGPADPALQALGERMLTEGYLPFVNANKEMIRQLQENVPTSGIPSDMAPQDIATTPEKPRGLDR